MRRAWSVGLAIVACGLLILFVRRVGARVVIEQCLTLGRALPAILALTFCKYPLQATAWRLVLPLAQRPPWWPSLRATLGAEALGFVTLAGSLTAEPLRAALLKPYLPVSTALAAGAVERALYASTAALVIASALAIAASRADRRAWVPALAATLVALVPAAVVLLGRRHAACGSNPDSTGWREVLRRLWFERRGTLHVIAGVCLAHHAVLIGEAYVMLHALGTNPTLATVVMFEGATKTANTVGTIVPGRLGIAEGGAAAMAGALGIGASYGLAVVLMRRVRALLWSIVGVPLVVPELWRMSRSPGQRRI
jgi:uncharacterized membrane protein YbhN (UPF0104 family)